MEVESAIVAYESVAEAAVVGRPDEVKGSALVAFVTLKSNATGSDEVKSVTTRTCCKRDRKLCKNQMIFTLQIR